MNKKAILFGLAVLGWTVMLFALAGQTAEVSMATSGQIENWLGGLIERLFPGADVSFVVRKGAHFSGFAVLGVLIYGCAANIDKLKHAFAAAFGASVILAVANELRQIAAEGRSCEFRDMCIDAGGALLGILAFIIINHIRKKRQLS